MVTSIQVSKGLKEELDKRKISKSDTYEDIIWDMLEDRMELSDETKEALKEAQKNISEGKTVSIKEIKRKYLKNDI